MADDERNEDVREMQVTAVTAAIRKCQQSAYGKSAWQLNIDAISLV
jgi:hypothetical protein